MTAAPPASALYVGRVMHHRLRPRAHHLSYRVWTLLLDLDEVDALAARLRWFSRRRFNLVAFHDRDHGDGSDAPLKAQAARLLARAGVAEPLARVRLLAMPRVLGFVFNPISMWFCHAGDGRLLAVIHQVDNTFGERHFYLLPTAADDLPQDVRQACPKRFHVSPFLPMDLDYRFRLGVPDARLHVAIVVRDAAGPVLTAVQQGTRHPLTDATLLAALATHPLLTLKVVAGILWEAAQLWAKRVPVHDHPSPPEHAVSLGAAGLPLPAAWPDQTRDSATMETTVCT